MRVAADLRQKAKLLHVVGDGAAVELVEIHKYMHRHLQSLPGDEWVCEVMTREFLTVKPETPVAVIIDC